MNRCTALLVTYSDPAISLHTVCDMLFECRVRKGERVLWFTTNSLENSFPDIVLYVGVKVVLKELFFSVLFRQRHLLSGKPAEGRFLSRLRV